MKHLSEVTSLKTSSPISEPKQDLTRPARVWLQLAEMFSKAFLRENGDEPSMLWQQAIWRLTDDQIKWGLACLGNDDLAFPPNLSQFVSACKREKPKDAWVKTTLIEDQRPRGRMSYEDWKKENGVES